MLFKPLLGAAQLQRVPLTALAADACHPRPSFSWLHSMTTGFAAASQDMAIISAQDCIPRVIAYICVPASASMRVLLCS